MIDCPNFRFKPFQLKLEASSILLQNNSSIGDILNCELSTLAFLI